MKSLIFLAALILLLAVLAAPAFAQDQPPELPPTAAEGVGWIKWALVAMAGLVSTRLTEVLSNISWLKKEDKEKVRQPLLDFVAAVIAIGSAYLLLNADIVAQFLDNSGWWSVILWAWPAAYAWFLGQKFTVGVYRLYKPGLPENA